jgi:hypothetical protein
MYNQVSQVKIGDRVKVDSVNHTGTVIDIKDGFVYSIDDKNQVCKFSDRDRFKIIDRLTLFAKIILDIVFFFAKRPKLKL